MAEDPKSRSLDVSELEAALGFWLRLAQQRDLQLFGRALSGSALSQLGFSVLLLIDANPGCRQAGLAAALRVRQPNLVDPIEALIGRGLVSRQPDPADRRAQVLRLTSEGGALVQRLREAHAGLIGAYRRALGEEGYGELVALLRRFTAAAAPPDLAIASGGLRRS